MVSEQGVWILAVPRQWVGVYQRGGRSAPPGSNAVGAVAHDVPGPGRGRPVRLSLQAVPQRPDVVEQAAAQCDDDRDRRAQENLNAP